MSKGVFFCSFKLKKGAVAEDFLQAAETLNREYISKQKGYVSWKQLCDGEEWADVLTFETMEDVKKFEADAGNAGELAQAFYSFINEPSCKVRYYTVEREY
jgi:hypothetical protein